MVILVAWSASSRLLVRPTAPADASSAVTRRRAFHESWLGSLLLGTSASALILQWLIGGLTGKSMPYGQLAGNVNWSSITYALTMYPSQFIWWAAALGGLALAWRKARRRHEPSSGTFPSVDPAQFIAMTLAISLLILLSAPIIAASSFSVWFLPR
jgi:hypothetical protein